MGLGSKKCAVWAVCLGLGLSLLPSGAAQAQTQPFNLALIYSIQIYDESYSIEGFRLSLAGKNRDMRGVDVGVLAHVTGDLTGVQWGVIHWVDGNGLGLQLGLLDHVQGRMLGAQLSGLNLAGELEGVQAGLLNYTNDLRGLQFGLVNITDHLHGLQLGLINIAPNGFLPVCVLVNFAM